MTLPFLDLAPLHAALRPALDAAYRRVMDAGWFVLGREVEAFEREFAAYCDVAHCVSVGTGLAALELILRGYGIGPGDEVIVPGHTFIATWLAVTATGATPVAADVCLESATLDPAAVERALSPKTRAIIPVHLYGRPADMKAIVALAREHDLRVVEDAAQAHGADHLGWRAGGLGDAAAFSFYPVKNLGALGDGGAITTNDAALAERVRLLRNYGSRVKYDHECAGTNSRLDELQAAFLRAKLPHLDAANAHRAAVAAAYREALGDIPELTLPADGEGRHAWHLFVVRHPRRDALRRHLEAHGVGTMIHYPTPPHRSDAYRAGGWRGGPLPVTERLASEVLSLPLGPHVTPADSECVADAIRLFPATRQRDTHDAPCCGRVS